MVLHKHIYKETICLRESVVRASKVYERWSSSGVLSACVQICLPNTSERERVPWTEAQFIGPHLLGKIKIWLPDLFYQCSIKLGILTGL